jgi:hypothetical protein
MTRAKVSSRVASGRFHESHMPAKAKGPGSVRVMAKTRLTGLAAFTLCGLDRRRSAEQISEGGWCFVGDRLGFRWVGGRDRPLVQSAGWDQASALREGFEQGGGFYFGGEAGRS